MEKILITGACGHIGSHLLDKLVGYQITAVDNMLTQRYCSLFNSNCNYTFHEKHFKDLTDNEIAKHRSLIHLAAVTDAASSFEDRAAVENANYLEATQFLHRCLDLGLKVIFPSTTSVYGDSGRGTVDENSILNPQSPYAESKLKTETYFADRGYDNFTALRLATIFGTSKGMRFHTAVNKFCWQAANDQPLTVWRQNYDMKRPYLGLNDAQSAIEIMLNSDPELQVYNILTCNETLSNVIENVKKVSGKDLKINMVDTPLLNQFTYTVDNQRATDMGFVAKDSMTRGIRETIRLLRRK